MKKAYFITDLHLGASFNGNERDVEKRAVMLLDSMKHDASDIFLLGDILDYWFEYKNVVPRGYVRFFGKLAELSDSGINITWLIGNHDIWIFDYIPTELGINVVDDVFECNIFGVPFSMQHGDAIGGDRKFRFLRALFRNRTCQKLYSALHPRWTVGFAYNCSRLSRLKKTRKKDGIGRRGEEWSPGLINKIKAWCEAQIDSGNKAKYFVFGHLHKEYRFSLPEDRELIVLPDWPRSGRYGMFDGSEFKILDFNTSKTHINML